MMSRPEIIDQVGAADSGSPRFRRNVTECLQIISANPQLSAMGPQIRQMMANPMVRQMMSNPETLRMVRSSDSCSTRAERRFRVDWRR